jgi:hypothetical protein
VAEEGRVAALRETEELQKTVAGLEEKIRRLEAPAAGDFYSVYDFTTFAITLTTFTILTTFTTFATLTTLTTPA